MEGELSKCSDEKDLDQKVYQPYPIPLPEGTAKEGKAKTTAEAPEEKT